MRRRRSVLRTVIVLASFAGPAAADPVLTAEQVVERHLPNHGHAASLLEVRLVESIASFDLPVLDLEVVRVDALGARGPVGVL